MQVPITEMLPVPGQYSVKCPYEMTGKGVVFHNTADKALSAQGWAKQRLGNNEQSSIHLFVDENEAVLCSPLDRNTWHAMDGGQGYANRNLWSVEVCRSTGDLDTFLKAEHNAAWVVAWLLHSHGLPANSQTIRWHFEFAATACPHRTRELGLDRIVPMVQGFLNEMGTLTGGDDLQAFDVFNGSEVNVQGFSSPDADAVTVNKIPNGRYMVYESGMALANSSLKGALIRYGDRRIYAPIRSDATELTAITAADAEERWAWFAGTQADHTSCEATLAAAQELTAAAEGRAGEAEGRAGEAEGRAGEAEGRASEAEGRADKAEEAYTAAQAQLQKADGLLQTIREVLGDVGKD